MPARLRTDTYATFIVPRHHTSPSVPRAKLCPLTQPSAPSAHRAAARMPLEAALEPATTAILAAAAVGSSENDQYHFSGLENHLNHFDLDIGQYQGGFQLLDLIITELKSHMTC